MLRRETGTRLSSIRRSIVLDTRNSYEVDIGTFEGAIDPRTVVIRRVSGLT